MGPAQRESVRIVLDLSGTPDDALGRKLIASSCGYYPPERPEVDVCLVCGREGWGCTCDPCSPNVEPTPEQIESARNSRLTCAELDAIEEAGE